MSMFSCIWAKTPCTTTKTWLDCFILKSTSQQNVFMLPWL